MNDKQRAISNCCKGIRDYGAAHTDRFSSAGFAGGLFTQMGQVVTRLEQFEASRVSLAGGGRQSTDSKGVVRNSIGAMLDGMNLAANAMAASTPGLENKFRRPRHRTDQAVLSAARASLADALPLKAEFIKYGMSPDFLEELQSLITEFEQTVTQQNERTQSRVSATAELEEAIDDGLKLRRQLNAVVRNTVRNDPGLLAAWESASHIERQSRPSEPPKPSSPPPPPPPTPPKE